MKKDSHILVRCTKQERDDFKKSVSDMSEEIRKFMRKKIKSSSGK